MFLKKNDIVKLIERKHSYSLSTTESDDNIDLDKLT